MQLFYNKNLTPHIGEFSFDKEESKHIAKVLRKKEGDTLKITNGKGFLFTAALFEASTNRCTVKILDYTEQPKRSYRLHMAVAPTKMNDRYEWFLEKATEIGVDEITPIICDHSERKVIKKERYERVLQSAMKQSLQCYLPILNSPLSFTEFIEKDYYKTSLFIAHCEETEKKSLRKPDILTKNSIILIGPEGDFSHKELENAYLKGIVPISLGKNRLRTETAAVVAVHSVYLLNS